MTTICQLFYIGLYKGTLEQAVKEEKRILKDEDSEVEGIEANERIDADEGNNADVGTEDAVKYVGETTVKKRKRRLVSIYLCMH